MSEFGFQLAFCHSDNPFSGTHVNIWGKFSEKSMEELTEVVKRVAPAAGLTTQLLQADVNNDVSVDFKSYEFRNMPYDYDEEAVRAQLRASPNIFPQFLEAYFTTPDKKTSSFGQRLRNAAHLMVEADSQTNHAIALSLCFSAIEALVCEKTDGIVDELSRHVSTLLEPSARERPDSIAGVKQYYNLRSKTLHGDHIVDDIDARWRARALASAVFEACIQWRQHVQMVGADIVRSDFLSELRNCSATGQQIVGVSDRLAKYIPVGASKSTDRLK